jgi:hypothetical protein
VAAGVFGESLSHFRTHSEKNHVGHDEHEEGVLCFLDINALLAMALSFNSDPTWFLCFAHHASLVFDVYGPTFLVHSLFLSSLHPPPRI